MVLPMGLSPQLLIEQFLVAPDTESLSAVDLPGTDPLSVPGSYLHMFSSAGVWYYSTMLLSTNGSRNHGRWFLLRLIQ